MPNPCLAPDPTLNPCCLAHDSRRRRGERVRRSRAAGPRVDAALCYAEHKEKDARNRARPKPQDPCSRSANAKHLPRTRQCPARRRRERTDHSGKRRAQMDSHPGRQQTLHWGALPAPKKTPESAQKRAKTHVHQQLVDTDFGPKIRPNNDPQNGASAARDSLSNNILMMMMMMDDANDDDE